MKKNYLGLFSHASVITIILICTLTNGVKSLAQETEYKIDIDNNGFFETIAYERQQIIQDYSMILDTGDVIHSINTPAGNSQGLTWDGSYLWVSDISTNMIYQVDPENGNVINSFDAPGQSSEGMAWDGTNLWVTDNGGGPFNPHFLYKIDPSDGTIISTIDLESMSWPHGITWDGMYLWVVNFNPKTITKIDPVTAEVLHTIPTPGTGCIGLTWDGNYLWTDDFETDLLYQISPEDGSVIYTVVSPHTNPRDLAWDGQYLWVVSALAWKIYQVDIGYVTTINENIADNFSLGEIAIFPNPFNKEIKFNYELYSDSKVSVKIYNQDGKIITTLLNQFQNNGKHTLSWDGTNSVSQQIPNGMYFCRFIFTNNTYTEKIFLLR